MSRENETQAAPKAADDRNPPASGRVPVPGSRVLPTGMTGVIKDTPPGSVLLGRLRGLRKVGG